MGLKVELGCGRAPREGFVHLDLAALPHVEIVYDLRDYPWTCFEDESVDEVYGSHVLEHLDFRKSMSEIYRILKPKGFFYAVVPYYTKSTAFSNPCHIHFFTWKTFDHIDPSTEYGAAFCQEFPFRFKIVAKRFEFDSNRVFRLIRVGQFANARPAIYEKYLAYTFPANSIKVILRKMDSGDI